MKPMCFEVGFFPLLVPAVVATVLPQLVKKSRAEVTQSIGLHQAICENSEVEHKSTVRLSCIVL